MNKHKKNLGELRRHLGRDGVSLAILDKVARDITELRKLVASLEESEGLAVTHMKSKREETTNAQAELSKVKAGLEKEKGRRLSAQANAERLARRVATLEQDAEVEDEAPLGGVAESDGYSRAIARLFKAVRKRFKRPPSARGNSPTVFVGDVAPNLTNDELLGLGMLVAAIAVHNMPVFVKAERTAKDVRGFDDRNTLKFALWHEEWTRTSPIEEKIRGPNGSIVVETKPW